MPHQVESPAELMRAMYPAHVCAVCPAYVVAIFWFPIRGAESCVAGNRHRRQTAVADAVAIRARNPQLARTDVLAVVNRRYGILTQPPKAERAVQDQARR